MRGIINNALRQRLLLLFKEGDYLKNLYIIFSYDNTRELAEAGSFPNATLSSVRNSPNISIAYAVRIDNEESPFEYAVRTADPNESDVSINGLNYKIQEDISSNLNELWNALYFNINAIPETCAPSSEKFFNIISVVTNLNFSTTSTPDYDGPSKFESASSYTLLFENSEIIIQSRPSKNNLCDSEYENFPGLITF
jgi:hypothetical protein